MSSPLHELVPHNSMLHDFVLGSNRNDLQPPTLLLTSQNNHIMWLGSLGHRTQCLPDPDDIFLDRPAVALDPMAIGISIQQLVWYRGNNTATAIRAPQSMLLKIHWAQSGMRRTLRAVAGRCFVLSI